MNMWFSGGSFHNQSWSQAIYSLLSAVIALFLPTLPVFNQWSPRQLSWHNANISRFRNDRAGSWVPRRRMDALRSHDSVSLLIRHYLTCPLVFDFCGTMEEVSRDVVQCQTDIFVIVNDWLCDCVLGSLWLEVLGLETERTLLGREYLLFCLWLHRGVQILLDVHKCRHTHLMFLESHRPVSFASRLIRIVVHYDFQRFLAVRFLAFHFVTGWGIRNPQTRIVITTVSLRCCHLVTLAHFLIAWCLLPRSFRFLSLEWRFCPSETFRFWVLGTLWCL